MKGIVVRVLDAHDRQKHRNWGVVTSSCRMPTTDRKPRMPTTDRNTGIASDTCMTQHRHGLRHLHGHAGRSAGQLLDGALEIRNDQNYSYVLVGGAPASSPMAMQHSQSQRHTQGQATGGPWWRRAVCQHPTAPHGGGKRSASTPPLPMVEASGLPAPHRSSGTRVAWRVGETELSALVPVNGMEACVDCPPLLGYARRLPGS